MNWKFQILHSRGLSHRRKLQVLFVVFFRLTMPTLLLCEYLRTRTGQKLNKDPNSAQPPRILVIRLDHIGDQVLSSSMMRELRQLYPKSHITLVASSAGRAIADACPYLDRVLAVNVDEIEVQKGFEIAKVSTVAKFCRANIQPGAFDIAIVPRWEADWYLATLISFYSRAKRRIAFSEKCSRKKKLLNKGFDRYYTEILEPGPIKHEVERNLDVVRHLGGNITDSSTELWLTSGDETFAKQWWDAQGLKADNLILACAPGSKKEKCRWPESNFARLIEELWMVHGDGLAVILICSPNEAALAEAIISSTNARVLMPMTTNVRQAAAIISRCSLLVGNNSGPIHLAAAAGISVVEVSCHPENGDPTDELNPIRFGAFGQRSTVVMPRKPKSPCWGRCDSVSQHCITAVSVEDVKDAVACAIAALGQPRGESQEKKRVARANQL